MRSDGKKLKGVDPMYRVVPYIMVHRHDAMNMITLNIPLEPIQRYIRRQAEQGVHITHMGVLFAAYLHTVAQFPALNRFIVNRKAYAHNDITISMVVLKTGSVEEETMSKIHLEPDDTLFSVQKKVDHYVNQNRRTSTVNSTDRIISILVNIPGLLRFGVGFLKWLDKHGMLPRAIIEASPFHASMLATNLASIRTNHIYHHVYDFGTTSMSMAIGNLREVARRSATGEVRFERCIPIGLVMDERIASGSYFARAFRVFKRYLKNPALLESPPAEIMQDV